MLDPPLESGPLLGVFCETDEPLVNPFLPLVETEELLDVLARIDGGPLVKTGAPFKYMCTRRPFCTWRRVSLPTEEKRRRLAKVARARPTSHLPFLHKYKNLQITNIRIYKMSILSLQLIVG